MLPPRNDETPIAVPISELPHHPFPWSLPLNRGNAPTEFPFNLTREISPAQSHHVHPRLSDPQKYIPFPSTLLVGFTTSPNMITKFMTEVTARFNPFSACAKPARLFLTQLPPNVRSQGVLVTTALLPKTSPEPSSVAVKFSTFYEFSAVLLRCGFSRASKEMATRLNQGSDMS
jgi:hypothetical protein